MDLEKKYWWVHLHQLKKNPYIKKAHDQSIGVFVEKRVNPLSVQRISGVYCRC